MNFKVGDIVRIDVHHWLRSQALGKIVAHEPDRKGTHQFLVEFPDNTTGKGFTDEYHTGSLLWFAADQLEVQHD